MTWGRPGDAVLDVERKTLQEVKQLEKAKKWKGRKVGRIFRFVAQSVILLKKILKPAKAGLLVQAGLTFSWQACQELRCADNNPPKNIVSIL